jgi:Cu-Zn family superoxide dismutase
MARNRILLITGFCLALGSIGCGHSRDDSPSAQARTQGSEQVSEEAARSTSMGSASEARAEAKFEDAPNVDLEGEAEFQPVPDGVRALVKIENATPGEHGIHVHENGDCSDIPGKSMGQHFAPDENPHGLPEASVHHLGDMGNIEVGPDGKGKLDFVIKDATLTKGSPNSLLGKALVVHEKQDIGTQPSGDSGTPIACAVIEQD